MPSLIEMQELRRERIAAASTSLPAVTPAGARLVGETVSSLTTALRDWIAAGRKLRGVKPAAMSWLADIPLEVAALLTARTVVDESARPAVPYHGLCLRIGTAICEEAEIRRRTRTNKDLKGHVHKIAKSARTSAVKRKLARVRTEIQKDFVMRSERLCVGAQMLQMLIEASGIVQIEKRLKITAAGPRNYKVVVPTAGLADWIANYNEQAVLLRPLFLPMSEPPHVWSSAEGGGYGPESGLGGRLIIGGSRRQAECAKPAASFLRAVNALQETPWTINEDVLEVFKTMWGSKTIQADLPSREPLEVPPEPTTFDAGSPEVRQWKREVAKILNAEQERRGRVIAYGRTAWLAEKLRAERRFWYPMFVDFRGRTYPRSGFVSPQGNDVSKSLLLFADGAPIKDEGAANWLRIHLANCFGIDKVPFADRLKWAGDNERRILSVGADPLDDRWWTEADQPWCFLAAAIDYWRFHQDGFGYVSRIPVAMDGSNNGLQLYSLLTGSADLARRTNVLPSAAPQDIYAEVAAATTLRLADVADGVGDVAVGVRCLVNEIFGGALPRSAVKRSVMTLPYGVTQYASGRYVVESIKEATAKSGKKLPNGIDQYAVLSAVADAVWAEIRSGVGPALECMDWIRNLARTLTSAGKPLRWTTPSGFLVEQRYEKTRWKHLKTILGFKSRVKLGMDVRAPTGELSVREAANGAPPNFVHSLDAAIMAGTVNRCHAVGIRQFAAVHDSFAVPAADAAFLAQSIRESVVDVFQKPPLDVLAEAVEADLGAPVERFHRADEFDVSEVLRSPYFFA